MARLDRSGLPRSTSSPRQAARAEQPRRAVPLRACRQPG